MAENAPTIIVCHDVEEQYCKDSQEGIYQNVPLNVGKLKEILKDYNDTCQVHLWVKTRHYKGQTNKWRQCNVGPIEMSPEGIAICQEWRDEYDG